MSTHKKPDVELTRNQSLVLNSLNRAQQPQGAYSLLDDLRDHGFKAPLQVYRTLDQLAELGLVHRLESLNAWTVCCADNHRVTPIFAICNDCGTVTEHLDEELADNISALPVSHGFVPNRSIIEIYGQCSSCAHR
jgi:Fur family zinc uptake transcriptional regulator